MLINMYMLIKMPRNLSGVVGHIAALNTLVLKGLPAKSFADLSQKKIETRRLSVFVGISTCQSRLQEISFK